MRTQCTIGTVATGQSLDYGWQVTNYLTDNAETLPIEYLIWQGRIWSVASRAEGWRPYDDAAGLCPRSAAPAAAPRPLFAIANSS